MLPHLLTAIRNRWHPLWRIRQSSLYRRFQAHFDRPVFTRMEGTGIDVSVKLLRDATWITNLAGVEPEIRAAFAVVLKIYQPKVFWDVGANIGFYSWLVRCHPSVERVVMCEPDPVNFALLRKTIEKNRLSDCEALNVAVADRVGEADFLLDRASGATGRLMVNAGAGTGASLLDRYGMSEQIRTRTETIDHLIATGTAPPDFVKIDVEGGESQVVAGAEACLRTARPVVIAETANHAVIERVRSFDYAVFQIDKGNALAVPHERDSAAVGYPLWP